LEQFRYDKNDELELLATVDMALEELQKSGKDINVQSVKQIIQSDKEWKAKLKRSVFSDANIAKALEQCRQLFSIEQAGE